MNGGMINSILQYPGCCVHHSVCHYQETSQKSQGKLTLANSISDYRCVSIATLDSSVCMLVLKVYILWSQALKNLGVQGINMEHIIILRAHVQQGVKQSGLSIICLPQKVPDPEI